MSGVVCYTLESEKLLKKTTWSFYELEYVWGSEGGDQAGNPLSPRRSQIISQE